MRPERYHSTGRGSLIACGGTKTAKVISVLQASDSWANTPCMPPKAVFWESTFIKNSDCVQAASDTAALTAAATSTVLKKKEAIACSRLTLRIAVEVIATSEVCAVIPMTKAK